MPRLIIIAFFTTASFFWASSLYAQETTFPSSSFEHLKQEETLKVTHVIDPLRLQLDDGRFAHLVGIEIPDFDIQKPGQIAITARDILQDMFAGQNAVLYITKDPKKGRVNRMGNILTHISRKSDGTWAQGTLLSLGLARVSSNRSNPEMVEEMLELETQARKQDIGLWALPKYQILNSDDVSDKHKRSFHIVEGIIQSAAINKNRIYLNFGPDWRTDFTVTVAPEHKRNFSKQKIDPLSWNNKRVRVRGWVEMYNGPFIEITHPEAIEILETTDERR